MAATQPYRGEEFVSRPWFREVHPNEKAGMRRVSRIQGDPVAMDIDTDKIDEAILALLYLTLHDGVRAWKSFDWGAMNRLHEKGLISDPVGKAKSVILTEAGRLEAERLFEKLFAKRD